MFKIELSKRASTSQGSKLAAGQLKRRNQNTPDIPNTQNE
jgi:hypothetical protein